MKSQSFLQSLHAVLTYHQVLGISHYPESAVRKPLETGGSAGPGAVVSSAAVHKTKTESPPGGVPIASDGARKQPEVTADAWLKAITACRKCADLLPREKVNVSQAGQTVQVLVVGDYCRIDQQENITTGVSFGSAEDAMLSRMFEAIQVPLSAVSITNIIACLPIAGSEPGYEQAQNCLEHFRRSAEYLAPKIILVMGSMPARVILERKENLSQLRGRLHTFVVNPAMILPVLVTYHPAFLLKNQEMKKYAWEDLQMLYRYLQSL